MSETQVKELRIHCICGQRMKVTEDMFGRPGRCVACRQKIWIPRADQVPPGVRSIYLKDHPEFIRKPKSLTPTNGDAPAEPVSSDSEIRNGSSADVEATPIDPLPVLQTLCSLEYRLERELAVRQARSGKEEGDSGLAGDRETLEKHLDEVRQAREALDEELRERLTEVAVELASTCEQIADAEKAARAGDLDFDAYREQADRLRRRREVLERRQHNCRGWLAVKDPFMAGGYVDIALEDAPTKGLRLTLPQEPHATGSLLDGYLDELRNALAERARIRREPAQLDQPGSGRDPAGATRKERRLEARAQRKRAKARVRFCRERLKQLDSDLAGYVQVVDAQLEAARARRKTAEIDQAFFSQLERDLTLARREFTIGRGLAAGALRARTAEEVPKAGGALQDRPAPRREGARFGFDVWLAWAGALLILVALFLPVLGDLSPLGAVRQLPTGVPSPLWLAIGGFVSALVFSLTVLLPGRGSRGTLLTLFWLCACLAAAIYFHEAGQTVGPLGERLRRQDVWLLRPGTVVLILGLVSVGASAWLALVRHRTGRALPLVVSLLLVLGLTLVFTDLAGLRKARPEVTADSYLRPGNGPPLYESTITIRNAGRRPLVLSRTSTAPCAFAYTIERKPREGAPKETAQATLIGLTGTHLRPVAGDLPPTVSIPRGEAVGLVYLLEPGTYEARLDGRRVALLDLDEPHRAMSGSNEEGPTAPARVLPVAAALDADAEPADSAESSGTVPSDEAVSDEESQGEAPVLTAAASQYPSVRLAGVIGGAEDREPLFKIEIRQPGGESEKVDRYLGDALNDAWGIQEYDPNRQTVTVSNGAKLIVMRRGEWIELDPTPRASGPAEPEW